MRTARLVGLSPDGKSLIVAADGDEELAVAVDDRLRAAVRNDRPRLGQLENQMESTLSPRDIQTRIRSGASLEDVVQASGLPIERVERFAAPVLAEREHIAATAMSSSVRRRGETSAHRNLRVTVTERLHDRGVDIDTIAWDASRREDGRWTVTADYHLGSETLHHAEFLYDLQGRFSVAGNDEARWLLGEQSTPRRPDEVRPGPTSLPADEEPTVDLDDELALVRATREAAAEESTESEEPYEEPRPAEAAEPTVAIVRRLTAVEITEVDEVEAELAGEPSELDRLYEMLGGDGYAEDSARVYPGLSDASAVPLVDDHDFEPAPAADGFPVEPVEDDVPEAPETVDPVTADEGAATGADELAPEASTTAEQDALIPGPTPEKKPARRKRASVPSWDEIMFGGPKKG